MFSLCAGFSPSAIDDSVDISILLGMEPLRAHVNDSDKTLEDNVMQMSRGFKKRNSGGVLPSCWFL